MTSLLCPSRRCFTSERSLYYVFLLSATKSINNRGKSYVKVDVNFPTGKALSHMGSFDYEG